jgi:hypothetical protein
MLRSSSSSTARGVGCIRAGLLPPRRAMSRELALVRSQCRRATRGEAGLRFRQCACRFRLRCWSWPECRYIQSGISCDASWVMQASVAVGACRTYRIDMSVPRPVFGLDGAPFLADNPRFQSGSRRDEHWQRRKSRVAAQENSEFPTSSH